MNNNEISNQTTVVLSIHCIVDGPNYFVNLHDGRRHFALPLTEGEAEELAEQFTVTIRNIITSPLPELPFDGNQPTTTTP